MQTMVNHATATLPKSAEGFKVCVGEEVFSNISDEDFRDNWDDLYRACPWGSVFQSYEFVSCWYRTYFDSYQPVLVLAREGLEGKLTGLLALAIQKGSRSKLVGAGHFDAEYQCWLAKEVDGESFITAGLAALQQRLPGHAVHLRFLPPGTPLNWTLTNPRWRTKCILQPARRPLMDMADPQLSKVFKKAEFKNKLNRLRRLGEVCLERVTDAGAFSTMLGELAVQYDFRQGALFNKNRFRENPLKAVFLQELFQMGLLHATVLKVNEEVVAAIAAVISKDWVHLGGINIHTPLNANYYSPGFVHFIMLGQLLSKEGFAVFDLTPGGDSYKDRMATKNDYVNELVVTDKLGFRLKKQFKKSLHDRLIKAGLRPMSVELAIRKKFYLYKSRLKTLFFSGPRSLVPQFMAVKTKHYNVLLSSLKQPSTSHVIRINNNSLADLLCYDGRGAWLTRWEFLEGAMRRFESGEGSYTWSEGGRLLACAWLGPVGAAAPAGTAGLRGIYCHPDGRGRLASFLAAAAGEACRDGGRVYAAAREAHICQALEAVGFKLTA